jgi:exopolysaccharide production protein ExoQ
METENQGMSGALHRGALPGAMAAPGEAVDRHGQFLCNAAGFMVAFKTCITFVWFQSDPKTGAAVEVGAMLALLAIGICYTVLNPPRQAHRFAGVRPVHWIFAYLGLATVSLLWTSANSLSVAAAYCAGTVAEVVLIVLVLRYEPTEQRVRNIMCGFIVGAALVAAIAWCAPPMEDMRLGHEEFMHPNLIGFDFALAAIFAIYLAHLNRAWVWVVAAFLITMVRTLSKGTIVGFIFAGLYYLVIGLKISRKARIYLGLVCTAVLLGFWGLLEAYLDLYTQGSNLETLTGRTYIWVQALELAFDKPWFGYGFDSFRWVVPPLGDFQPGHAHNEIIQQFFAYGIVGLLIVAGVYWSFYRQVRLSTDANLKAMATAMLILVLVRGLVDTDRFELCFPLWLMTSLSVALASTASPQPST